MRLSLPNVLMAILLVLVVPLERGLCTCGNVAPATPRATTAMVPGHCHAACCTAAAARAAHGSGHGERTAGDCGCSSYSAAVLPMVPAVVADDAPIAAFGLLPSLASVEPVSEPSEHPLALDVGSPPIPDPAGAHALRAPPALA